MGLLDLKVEIQRVPYTEVTAGPWNGHWGRIDQEAIASATSVTTQLRIEFPYTPVGTVDVDAVSKRVLLSGPLRAWRVRECNYLEDIQDGNSLAELQERDNIRVLPTSHDVNDRNIVNIKTGQRTGALVISTRYGNLVLRNPFHKVPRQRIKSVGLIPAPEF